MTPFNLEFVQESDETFSNRFIFGQLVDPQNCTILGQVADPLFLKKFCMKIVKSFKIGPLWMEWQIPIWPYYQQFGAPKDELAIFS